MIDRFRLWAKGGDGGNGCSSFRRSRHDRRGRPDGRSFLLSWSCTDEVSSAVLLTCWSYPLFFLLEHPIPFK